MTTREEEMAKLKARYARTRGKIIEEPVVQKEAEPVRRIVVNKKDSFSERIKKFINSYLVVIESDFRRVMGLKSREALKKEKEYDPLMAAWKRGRNLQ
jgi:hypothetical protein